MLKHPTSKVGVCLEFCCNRGCVMSAFSLGVPGFNTIENENGLSLWGFGNGLMVGELYFIAKLTSASLSQNHDI